MTLPSACAAERRARPLRFNHWAQFSHIVGTNAPVAHLGVGPGSQAERYGRLRTRGADAGTRRRHPTPAFHGDTRCA